MAFLLFLFFTFLVGFLIYLARLYNGLHRRSEGVREAHSNIIVSMKKRIDLANKLIDIASSYGDHEKLTHISIARADGASDTAVIAASAEAAGAVQSVLKLATRYPELRASETYNLLMTQLESVEQNLQDRREAYNGLVRAYNSELGGIPTNFFAPALGFRQAPYFNVDDADSLDGLKEFSSGDGEVLKTMLAGAGKRVLDTTRDVSRRVADTTKEVGAKAFEAGREAAERYQAGQGTDRGAAAGANHGSGYGTPGEPQPAPAPGPGDREAPPSA